MWQRLKKKKTLNLKCKIWAMSMRLTSLLKCCTTMNVLQEVYGEGGRQDRERLRLLDLFLWLHHVALQASKGDSCFFSIQSGERWGHLRDCWASVTNSRGKLCCAMVVWCSGSLLRDKMLYLVKTFDRINLLSDHFNFCIFRLIKKLILYCFD